MISIFFFAASALLVFISIVMSITFAAEMARMSDAMRWPDGTPLPYTRAAKVRVIGVWCLRLSLASLILALMLALAGV